MRHPKVLPCIIAAALLSSTACKSDNAANSEQPKGRSETIDGVHHFIPAQGMVPDERTALRIAEAVLTPIYGQATLDDEKPFVATLSNGTWSVSGSLPNGHVGGVAIIEISQADGRIIRVSHGL